MIAKNNDDINIIDYGYDLTDESHWGDWIPSAENERSHTANTERKKEWKDSPFKPQVNVNRAEPKKATAIYSFVPKYEGELSCIFCPAFVIYCLSISMQLLVFADICLEVKTQKSNKFRN